MPDTRRDAEASPVNTYTDPELYDAENHTVDELPVLLPLARAAGGLILDLACGTGRTTFPLAHAGHRVIGVDASEPMVALARAKAAALGLPVEFHVQDCRQLELPLTASMVTMTGNAFQEFLTNDDQDALFGSVHRHLEAGGVFVFGTRLPSGANLERPAGEQPWSSVSDRSGRAIDISVIWSYDAAAQLQDYTFIERLGHGTTGAREQRSYGRLRYTGPMEMRRLLGAHGFALRAMYGGWDASPLTNESAEMVVVARRGG